MRCLLSALLVISVLVGGGGRAQGQPSYNYTILTAPPGFDTPLPAGINSSGQIVGVYDDPSRGLRQPFLLSGGSYTTLIPARAVATGINDAGQIVLTIPATIEGNPNFAFLLSGGTLTSLDMPGSTSTGVSGINNRGQIVGISSLLGSFLLSGGTYTPIGVPGAMATLVAGINDSGQIVGQYMANGVGHGFVLSGSSYTTLDVPGAIYTFATGINNSGQIVGRYGTPDHINHGFLFSGDSFIPLAPPGSYDTLISGINDSGEIVGTYVDRSSQRVQGFVATPTPEPSTLLLLGVGTVALLGWANWKIGQDSII
jgi:probable HAF family extracellular repeat protein